MNMSEALKVGVSTIFEGSGFFSFLQLLGGVILSIGYIPQIRQILKTKSVKDLNFFTYVSITFGILLMQFYAVNLVVSTGSGHAFLLTNTVSLGLVGFIAYLIGAYSEKKITGLTIPFGKWSIVFDLTLTKNEKNLRNVSISENITGYNKIFDETNSEKVSEVNFMETIPETREVFTVSDLTEEKKETVPVSDFSNSLNENTTEA